MSRTPFVLFLLCFLQGVFSQAINSNGLLNNGAGFNGLAANLGTNGMPYGNFGPNNLANSANVGNTFAPSGFGYQGNTVFGNAAPNCGNSFGGKSGTPAGFGDVAVAGEIPVGGSTAVSGNLPVIGYVTFEGYLPADGLVSLANNCGCNNKSA